MIIWKTPLNNYKNINADGATDYGELTGTFNKASYFITSNPIKTINVWNNT